MGNYLARASLVLPRGGSRRPHVVITAARVGGLVNKAASCKIEMIKEEECFEHLWKPWYDAVRSGLNHSLLPVDLLLRGGLQVIQG